MDTTNTGREGKGLHIYIEPLYQLVVIKKFPVAASRALRFVFLKADVG